MANVTVNGNNYTGVTEVLLPITNGGGSEQSFIIPSGSKNITANGNGIDVAAYESVNVNVPGDTPSLQQKSVTAPASGTTAVTPDSGYDGLSRVTVSPTPTETKNITANGTYTPTSGKHFSQVTVNVSGDTPQTQEKTVTPSAGQQVVTPDSGMLLSKVTVNAIQTETKSATPSATAQTITPTSGKFLTSVTVNGDADLVEGNIKSGVNIFGVTGTYTGSGARLQSKTVSPTTSQQTVNPDSGYDGLSQVTVNAMPAGTAGTPTASKGAVSNHSVAVTPSVTNVTGYITGGTKTGTPVTVSASELVSGSETKTQNGTYDVTNLAQLIVNVSGGSTVQTHSGTATTNSSGIAVINDCGFRPDIVLLEIGTYTIDGNTYYSSMTFPLFADRVNSVESVAWADSAGVNFNQFYGIAYDQTQNGVTIRIYEVRSNWQIIPLASIPVPYTAYKFL